MLNHYFNGSNVFRPSQLCAPKIRPGAYFRQSQPKIRPQGRIFLGGGGRIIGKTRYSDLRSDLFVADDELGRLRVGLAHVAVLGQKTLAVVTDPLLQCSQLLQQVFLPYARAQCQQIAQFLLYLNSFNYMFQ